jgi:hypothetical protein
VPLLLVDLDKPLTTGLPCVWLHRGRRWPLNAFKPDHAADGFPEAVSIAGAASGRLPEANSA